MTSALTRVTRRPKPEDWADDAPMTLAEAVAVFSDDYPMTVSTLRTEIRKSRLTPARVAGTLYVTPAQIKALFRCPAMPKAPGSTSAGGGSTPAPARRSPTPTSSVMERDRLAQAAALTALAKLSGSSPNTSPRSGARRKAAPTADVIPLRS